MKKKKYNKLLSRVQIFFHSFLHSVNLIKYKSIFIPLSSPGSMHLHWYPPQRKGAALLKASRHSVLVPLWEPRNYCSQLNGDKAKAVGVFIRLQLFECRWQLRSLSCQTDAGASLELKPAKLKPLLCISATKELHGLAPFYFCCGKKNQFG